MCVLETFNMKKILISACLLGQKVRYDGNHNLQTHTRLKNQVESGHVIALCPEIEGGLPVPRPPAEIQHMKTAVEVLNGTAKIITNKDTDVTLQYVKGARFTLAVAKKNNIQVAILKARSPSCGSKKVYDGTFSRTLIDGMGITTALLTQHGIKVYNEDQIDEALDTLLPSRK